MFAAFDEKHARLACRQLGRHVDDGRPRARVAAAGRRRHRVGRDHREALGRQVAHIAQVVAREPARAAEKDRGAAAAAVEPGRPRKLGQSAYPECLRHAGSVGRIRNQTLGRYAAWGERDDGAIECKVVRRIAGGRQRRPRKVLVSGAGREANADGRGRVAAVQARAVVRGEGRGGGARQRRQQHGQNSPKNPQLLKSQEMGARRSRGGLLFDAPAPSAP